MADYLKKPLAASTNQLAQQRAADALQQTGMSLPAKVTEVLGPGIVKVSFEVDGGVVTLPQIIVPVQASAYIYYPIQVGDLGLVQAATVRLGGVTGLGAGVPALTDVPGNLSALSFVWLGNKNWAPSDDPDAVCIQAPNGLIARNDDDDTRITVNADGFAQIGKAGFFGTAPVDRPTVTGALSAITDSAAKAVLTSLIAALASEGLIMDGTT